MPERVLSSFVGRTDLIDRLVARLGEARLVTLIGPGGVGKTRLAVETVRRVQASFPDGAVFCDLTEAGPIRVATVVLGALGIESRSGQGELGRLADVLRTDRTLLVLDNCEHVLDDAAAFAEGLLQQTENVVMLTTTRERLAVDGEQLVVIPPLSSEVDSVAGISPAVELLRDRARSVLPQFELDLVGRQEVEDLCRRLDGLPLAIELAAGRLQTLSLNEVMEGLDANLAVLRGGRRTVDRHRSVEAALDWSYQLLDEPDRAVLHAASTFAGRSTWPTLRTSSMPTLSAPETGWPGSSSARWRTVSTPTSLSSTSSVALLSSGRPLPRRPLSSIVDTPGGC